jgi:hypothetical protein
MEGEFFLETDADESAATGLKAKIGRAEKKCLDELRVMLIGGSSAIDDKLNMSELKRCT